MKIAEAKQKTMDIANGAYHSITYEVNDHGNGSFNQKCKIYIRDFGSFEGPHWEDCFHQIELEKLGRPVISEDVPVSTQVKP